MLLWSSVEPPSSVTRLLHTDQDKVIRMESRTEVDPVQWTLTDL